MAFANGRVAVFLEGGYFIESLKEGVAMSLRALLGEPCLTLGALPAPDDTIVESILNLTAVQKSKWHSLNLQDVFEIDDYSSADYSDEKELVVQNCHIPKIIYKGKELSEKSKNDSEYESDYEKYESEEVFQRSLNEMADLRKNYEDVLMKMSTVSYHFEESETVMKVLEKVCSGEAATGLAITHNSVDELSQVADAGMYFLTQLG